MWPNHWDSGLPLSSWGLYNSNCVQICMSSACHFLCNNLLYACCDVHGCDSDSKPLIIHIQFHIQLCICKTQRQPDWQGVTATPKFHMYVRVWGIQILTEIWCGWRLWWTGFSISRVKQEVQELWYIALESNKSRFAASNNTLKWYDTQTSRENNATHC